METKLFEPPPLSLHLPSLSSSTANFTTRTFISFPLRNNHTSFKSLAHNSGSPHTDPVEDNQQSQSSKPIYSPTPPNRQLRTPHSGYAFFFVYIIHSSWNWNWYFLFVCLGITLMELLGNSLRVGTSKFPFRKKGKAFASCIPLRILRFANHWRLSNWLNMDLGLLVLGPKFLVLMINTFANTLRNHTTSGEVSN